jgi:hypothetical protein
MLSLTPPSKIIQKAGAALLFLALPLMAGCSGGGSTSNLPSTLLSTPAPPPPPPVNYDTAEYRQNWGLGAVSAISAYNAGFTGKGIRVAVVDTGIDVNNTELKANIDPASTNIVTNNPANLQDTDGHGTAVAGVVAAVRNGVGTEGVAFDASLLAINATSNCGTNCDFFQSDIANGVDYARLHGAKIVNLSMGGVAVGVSLEDAMRRAVSAGMIIVISAGNDSAATPSDFARVAESGWANGQIVIAGASNQAGDIATFSNKAGDLSKNYYLLAPGENIQTSRLGGGINLASGTSFSAPLAAGAMAILMQEFPNLTAAQVTNILFTTATDLGATGVDNIYGYGLLNLAKAIAPIGTASIPTGAGPASPVSGSGGLLTASAVHLSGAFGDALAGSPALSGAMILDSYQRSYRMDLTARIRRDASLPDISALTEPGRNSISRELHPATGTMLQLTADQNNAFAEIDRNYFTNTDPARRHQPELRWRLSQKLGENLSLEAGSKGTLLGSPEQNNTGLFLTEPERQNPATGKPDDLAFALTHRLAAGTTLTVAAAHSRLHDNIYRLDARQNTAAARLTQYFGPKLGLSLDLGTVNETGSVLGAMSSGALALGDGAITTYLGLGLNWQPAPAVHIFSQLMSGRTKVEAAANSLFQNVSSLQSRSFRAGITAAGVIAKADRLGFMISEPLRVTRGAAQLRLATARDYTNNTLTFEARDASLTPSGRELDLEASYRIPLSDTLLLQAMLLHQINAGHIAGGASQTLAVMRFSRGF